MQGHIYISSVQERKETKFICDCSKMNGGRGLLHADAWKGGPVAGQRDGSAA